MWEGPFAPRLDRRFDTAKRLQNRSHGIFAQPFARRAGYRRGGRSTSNIGRFRSSEMPANQTIPFAKGIARILSRADLNNCEAWQNAFAGEAKDHRFYEIVADTLDSKFEHHYLLLEDQHGKVRAVQPVFFVQQNLVEGIPALRDAVEKIRRRFPRFLTMRLLMIGNAAGEGHLSVSAPEDEEWVANALYQVLEIYGKASKASLVVFKDFPAKYRDRSVEIRGQRLHPRPEHADDGTDAGLHRFRRIMSARWELRPGRISAANSAGLTQRAPIDLEVVTDSHPFVEEVYPLYLQVHERSPLKFETLSKEYLSDLGRRMPDRARFFVWRQQGKAIAFSVALVNDGMIYDDYLGLDYRVALDLHLYFHTLRDILSWSLGQGLNVTGAAR